MTKDELKTLKGIREALLIVAAAVRDQDCGNIGYPAIPGYVSAHSKWLEFGRSGHRIPESAWMKHISDVSVTVGGWVFIPDGMAQELYFTMLEKAKEAK